jgi:hypothetical protein
MTDAVDQVLDELGRCSPVFCCVDAFKRRCWYIPARRVEDILDQLIRQRLVGQCRHNGARCVMLTSLGAARMGLTLAGTLERSRWIAKPAEGATPSLARV